MTESDVTVRILSLYEEWIRAIQTRRFDWFERHLADDYTCTAHPFMNFYLRKREFIEADMKVDYVAMHVVDVRAHRVGGIVLSNLVAKVEEERHAVDLGDGLPTAAEISALVTGRTVAYSSAWRTEGSIWQCFDHHLVGPID
jgi:hypothetical protein